MKRNTTMKRTILFAASLVSTALFIMPAVLHADSSGSTCTLTLDQFLADQSAGKISYTAVFSGDGSHGLAHIVNNTGCSAPISFNTYKVFITPQNPGWLDTQLLFDQTPTTNIAPNSTLDLSVSLPSCKSQIDLWYGTGPSILTDANPYSNTGYLPHFLAGSVSNAPLCAPPVHPSCPIPAASGRTIVTFDPNIKICSYFPSGGCPTVSGPVPTTLPAGDYIVRAVAWDGYPGRQSVTQLYEQYKAVVSDGSGTIATSGATPDLPDNVIEATVDAVVNDATTPLHISRPGTGVSALHAYAGNTSSANSVFPICASFDLIPPPPTLSGSCSVTLDTSGAADTATWSATASGGNGTFTYTWSGDEGLSGTSASVVKTYNSAGTKNGTVVITSGGQSLTKTCTVNVTGPTIPTCPIPPAAGRTIVSSFPNELCSYVLGTCKPTSGPLPVTLAPGLYKVTLSSFDGYFGRENVTQPHEQWYASLQNGSGQVAASAVIGDLPDMVRVASLTQTVNDTGNLLTVPAGVTSVLAVHAFPDPTGKSSPNSHYPICAAFDYVPPSSATLTVVKDVVNTNGGTKTPADFMLHVKAGATDVAGSPAAGSATGVNYTLPAGTYTVGEDSQSGYTLQGITGDCDTGGNVTLAAGDHKTCTLTNHDTATPPPPFDGSCSASPSTVNIGDTVTWTGAATGGTGSYAYSWTGDEGLSATGTSTTKSYSSAGTKNASVTITSGASSITRQCTVVVQSPPGGGTLVGSCAVSTTIANINDPVTYTATASGGNGTYTYSWSGDENLTGNAPTVTKNYISSGTKSASVLITSGNQTLAAGGCSVNIRPPEGCTANCGGGGMNQPTVVLYQKPSPSPLASVFLSQIPYTSSVSLTQIPYTGLGGPSAVIIFFVILGIWGTAIVFVFRNPRMALVSRRFSMYLRGLTGTLAPVTEGSDSSFTADMIMPVAEAYRDNDRGNKSDLPPINLPTGDFKEVTAPATGADIEAELAIRAKRDHTLISPDGLKYIIEKANEAGVSPVELLDHTVETAKRHFTREDGWILLNRNKVFQVLVVPEMPRDEGGEDETGDLVLESAPGVSSRASVATADVVRSAVGHAGQGPAASGAVRPQGATQEAVANREPGKAADVNTFVNLLSHGDEAEVFAFIRNLRESNISVEQFIRRVILELDEVFRSRVEREALRSNIVLGQIASKWNETDLEKVIAILLTIIDKSYKDTKVGAKLASLRIASMKQ